MSTHSIRIRTALASVALAAIVPVGVVVAHDGAPNGGEHDHGAHDELELTGRQRAEIRAATRRFRDVDAAIAAGYLPTDTCAALPDGSGGMGYHYLNPALASDADVDPKRPELLLYVSDSRGGLRLAGVEYFVADADQDTATDDDRPTLMGHAFDGPMEGHEPGMPIHYDLHAWVFDHNPDGDLAAWNPNVTCP